MMISNWKKNFSLHGFFYTQRFLLAEVDHSIISLCTLHNELLKNKDVSNLR